MSSTRRTTRSRRRTGVALVVRALEPLEGRSLMSVGTATPLLVQLSSASPSPADLAGSSAGAPTTWTPSGVPGLYQVQGDATSLNGLAAALAGSPGVRYVEPEQTVRVQRTPDDPYYANGSMWGLNGANGIKAEAAWDVTTGSTRVTVADIDTGLDYNHPDLYENVWINQREIPASRLANLKDVDGDGLITFYDLNDPSNQGPGKITDVNGDGRIDAADILAPMVKDANGKDTGAGGWADPNNVQDGDTAHPDDLIGWNFVTNTNNPFDDHGHGTHTGGTIAAIGDNGQGVVGVNWIAQLMPLKFIAANGSGTDADAAAAIRYAADHGARVSNNSYGDPSPSQPIADAIAYARSKGDVFVAAAGNNASNNDTTPFYPASVALDNVISVAAIDSTGALASFSNYGATTVDLAAPGVNILSTYHDSGYAYLSGTSMAAPHVTGTVALVMAAHPDWTYSQVIARILGTVTANPALAGKTVTGGVLNAAAAVTTTPPSGGATFVRADAVTQGTWKPAYGANGFDLVLDPSANNPSLPAYATATVTTSGSYAWAASTTDPRALQRAAPGSTDRVAACWYSYSTESIDVHLTDGATHQVALYAVDYDHGGRAETVQVIDDTTGAVLDTRTLSGFDGGTYLVWNLTGNVTLKVTNTGANNAVISGLFFDPKTS